MQAGEVLRIEISQHKSEARVLSHSNAYVGWDGRWLVCGHRCGVVCRQTLYDITARYLWVSMTKQMVVTVYSQKIVLTVGGLDGGLRYEFIIKVRWFGKTMRHHVRNKLD